MKSIFGKKQVLMAALVLALGLAVYLNYFFSLESPNVSTGGKTATTTTSTRSLGDSQFVNNTTTKQETTTTTGSSYFTEARKNREKAREEALGILQETLANVKATDAMKKEAASKAEAIAKAVEQESKIESLIKAKGFADCVVYIENENCSVVVQSDGLKPQETLQITEIITSQSNVKAENISIITVK